MRVVRLLAAGCLVSAALWAANAPAGAAELETYSWWFRGNMGPAPLPPPPTVPEGGILIGGAPDGATAIAAVRYILAPGESSPILTLRVASETGADAAVIAACPAGSAWGPNERGGPWEARPNTACELGSVNGQRDAAAGTWTFPLAPLVQGTTLDVVIVPGTITPEVPASAPFQIAFHGPDAGALATTSSGSSGGEATAADFAPPVVEGFFDPELPSGGLDVTPAADLPSVTPFAPALPPSSQGITATAPAVELAQRPVQPVVPASTQREGAGFAFLVVLVAIAAMYYANKAGVPPSRRLGPLSGSVAHIRPVPVRSVPASTGGLGRFARARSGTPPPLS